MTVEVAGHERPEPNPRHGCSQRREDRESLQNMAAALVGVLHEVVHDPDAVVAARLDVLGQITNDRPRVGRTRPGAQLHTGILPADRQTGALGVCFRRRQTSLVASAERPSLVVLSA